MVPRQRSVPHGNPALNSASWDRPRPAHVPRLRRQLEARDDRIAQLRLLHADGTIAYPYSVRELVLVANDKPAGNPAHDIEAGAQYFLEFDGTQSEPPFDQVFLATGGQLAAAQSRSVSDPRSRGSWKAWKPSTSSSSGFANRTSASSALTPVG